MTDTISRTDISLSEDEPTVAVEPTAEPVTESDVGSTAAQARARTPKTSLWRSGRAVWILAAVGITGLIIGYIVGGVVVSPGQAQAPAPVEGLITAKVEARQITGTVVARADVAFADRVKVSPPTPEGAAAAIVTGQVPTVGAQINAGDVVLEVSGQPVFVLPGAFGSYRSLGAGSSGADVVALRAALNGLGLNAGAESSTYDAALSDAVRALYTRAGYTAPDGGDQADQGVRAGEDSLIDARTSVTQAESNLTQARAAAERARTDRVSAGRELEVAIVAQQAGPVTQTGTAPGRTAEDLAASVKQANTAVNQADLAVEQADLAVTQAETALTSTQRGATRAEQALSDAQRAAWATVPVGAVVFVPDLPRRVDEVNVKVGDNLANLTSLTNGSTQTVSPVVLSGAQITVTANVEPEPAKLLAVGGSASLTAPSGGVVEGTIAAICDLTTTAALTTRCPVEVILSDPAAPGVSELVGNVQVTMVVGTSSADSLIVPVAAVSADTAGRARITVVDGQLEPGVAARDQKTVTVSVETGLSAEGMVEITKATPAIKAGDLVVIGQGAVASASASAIPR